MNKKIYEAMKAELEARMAVNTLDHDAPEEERNALIAKANEAQQALAEALAAGQTVEAPPELRDRISLVRYLEAAANETTLDGAEAELRKELRLSDENIPLDAFLPGIEERADVVSPQNAAGNALPSGTININTGPLLTRVFSMTDGAFLGIPMPMVPPGTRRYPVMTAGTEPGMVARGAGIDAGAAKFDVVDVAPLRGVIKYKFDREGVAEMGALLESTLRSDAREAIGRMLDIQVLNGDGTGANVSGILKELTAEAQPGATFANGNNPDVLTWALAKELGYGSLDGQYLRSEGDLRVLVGKATYDLMRSVYRGDNADNMDGVDVLRGSGVSLRPSYQIAAPAVATVPPKSADSTKKVQNAVLTSMPSDAVMPIWQGISTIRDPYTDADKGFVTLTMTVLYNFTFRRKNAWKRYLIQTEK